MPDDNMMKIMQMLQQGKQDQRNVNMGIAGGGTALGMLGSLFGGGGLMGKPGKWSKLPQYSPAGMGALDWLIGQGRQNADWGPIEQQYKNQFQSETIPGLAERFSAMGPGAQRSSGFQSALGRAGGDLSSQLAALRSQFGMQQLGMGLRPQHENVFTPGKPGMFEGGFQSLMSMLPLLMAM